MILRSTLLITVMSVIPAMAMTAKFASSSAVPSSYRVAILGGGVAGCASARRLAELAPPSTRITLYEMGRGPGGRASTRKTRSAPDIYINHGAPYAEIRSSMGRSLMSSLGPSRVAPFSGIRGSLDSSTGRFSRAEEEGVDYVTGTRGEMSQISSSLISSDTLPSIETRYSTMVRHLSRSSDNGEWELRDKSRQLVGSADWLIVAGSGIAHPRWTDAFGGHPPLVAAETERPDPKLREALDAIAAQQASPVMAVFFSCSGSIARQWLSLGFNVADVEGSSILSKVMIQGGNTNDGDGDGDDDDEWCSIVLHSTEDFAVQNSGVYGASSTAARVGDAVTDASIENNLIEKMLMALEEIPGMHPVNVDTNVYTYGPALHRWGNAFPKGDALCENLAFLPSSRIAFCGDYVASSEQQSRFGGFESALLSGTFAGENIAKYCEEGV